MPGRKYTFEERLEVVMHYFASDEGYRLTSARFNIPRTQVRMWVAAYDAYGEEGLRSKYKGVSVDPEIRVAAIKDVLEGKMSYNQVAIKYKIAGPGVIAKWLKVFDKNGYNGLRSLRVGKRRELHMIETPEAVEAAIERSKVQRIKELEGRVKYLELKVLYLKKLKALVR